VRFTLSIVDNLFAAGGRPAYGLNVLSMTKHQTLVLTEAAVEHITRRLLFALNRSEKNQRNDRVQDFEN
jgi:hypothetical protein